MHVPPRVRGGLVARWVALLVGLFLFALAIVCQLESGLGLSPWDVLHQGIAEHTPLSFGAANVVVGVVVMAVAWALGATIGFATVANSVLVGARTHRRLGVVRAGIELLALAVGFALGGTVGIGTVVFAVSIGPALEAGFWLLRRSPVGEPPPLVTPAPAPLAGS